MIPRPPIPCKRILESRHGVIGQRPFIDQIDSPGSDGDVSYRVGRFAVKARLPPGSQTYLPPPNPLTTMPYYFGIYHWQRRFRRLFAGIAPIAIGALLWKSARLSIVRVVAFGLILAGVRRTRGPLRSMLDPPPWSVRAGKYARLASSLSVPAEGRVLDVGCGTGRSLVGLADGLPAGTEVVGLDVFDDRVILGNGPRLAARNARLAGLDPTVVAGDAARLPVADDSMDAVTACRVLHDLPKEDAEAALSECRRVLRPGGRLGVLELPLPHDRDADPDTYWREQLVAAGFDVTSAGSDDGYFRYVATLAEQ